jgi:hypothetical protein
MLRDLTEHDDVCFTVEAMPEDVPIEGNASAINDETDAATEAWIRKQLDAGNVWAWATITVRARWNGFEGQDVLGCCSYESEKAFREPGGYFDDMCRTALAALNDELAHIDDELEALRG